MERRIYVAVAVVFVAAVVLTVSSSRMMGTAMPMPGGWTMSMAWMRMPGQSWLSAATMFAGMWAAMMVAMMLPSTLPMILLYRRAILFRREPRPGLLMWMMASAYFLVWTAFGLATFAAGVGLADAAMGSPAISRAVPLAAGAALLVAGIYQLTPWKTACLEHCRDPLTFVSRHLADGWRGAMRLGLHHGLYCTGCCWALMLMQIVMGVMHLGAMMAIAAIIALEKLTVRGPLLARGIGIASMAAGAWILSGLRF